MSRLKVVFVGNEAVGKTQLISRMRNQDFNPSHDRIFGANFHILKDDQTELDIWDLAGAQFSSIENSFLRGADIVCLCVDLSQLTMDNLKADHEKFQSYSSTARRILVGTKADLATDEVKEHFLNVLDDPISAPQILKQLTSAKSNDGVEAFKQAMFGVARSLAVKPNRNCLGLSTESTFPGLSEDKPRDVGDGRVVTPNLKYTEADVDRENILYPNIDAATPLQATSFIQMVAQHPAMNVIGALLVMGGLIALGIGIACLCPAWVPVMAGIGIALSQSAATSLVISGGCGLLVGTMMGVCYKNATRAQIVGDPYEDVPQEKPPADDHEGPLGWRGSY